jgi:spore coat protein U-like protein
VNPLRLVAFVLLLVLAALSGRAAAAPPACSLDSITNLSFGTVDPIGGNVDAVATLSYHCTFTGFLTGGSASMCFNIGRGTGGTTWTPRTLKNGTQTMNFQIYQDASRTLLWSGTGGPPSPDSASVQFPAGFLNTQTQSGQLTLYGRVPLGQVSLASGNYTSFFSGGDATMTYNAAEAFLGPPSPPSTCTGDGSDSVSFTASANVASLCRIDTATDMAFGAAPSNFASNLDQTSAITMTCTSGTAWNLGLDNGQNASGLTRRMKLGASFVTYELYRNSGRSLRWGNTIGADTLTGTGSGTGQSVPVYGRVPVQSPVPAGSYSDKVTVTVTY